MQNRMTLERKYWYELQFDSCNKNYMWEYIKYNLQIRCEIIYECVFAVTKFATLRNLGITWDVFHAVRICTKLHVILKSTSGYLRYELYWYDIVDVYLQATVIVPLSNWRYLFATVTQWDLWTLWNRRELGLFEIGEHSLSQSGKQTISEEDHIIWLAAD
jgi:hypothetical protein